MIISNEHQFIYFFSIGNTATRSMQALMSQFHDDQDISVNFGAIPEIEKYVKDFGVLENYKKPSQKIFLDREVTPRYLKGLFTNLGREEDFSKYKKYATVRHPFQLIASIARSNHLGYIIDWRHFGECLRMVEHQWRSHGYDPVTLSKGQYKAYLEIGGGQMIDKFLRMEKLKDDLSETFQFIDIDKLQHFRHDYNTEYRTAWQKEVGEGIIDVWQEDFKRFNYSFSSDGGFR